MTFQQRPGGGGDLEEEWSRQRNSAKALRWQRASSRVREVGNGVKEAVAASLCGAFEMGPRKTLASGF